MMKLICYRILNWNNDEADLLSDSELEYKKRLFAIERGAAVLTCDLPTNSPTGFQIVPTQLCQHR